MSTTVTNKDYNTHHHHVLVGLPAAPLSPAPATTTRAMHGQQDQRHHVTSTGFRTHEAYAAGRTQLKTQPQQLNDAASSDIKEAPPSSSNSSSSGGSSATNDNRLARRRYLDNSATTTADDALASNEKFETNSAAVATATLTDQELSATTAATATATENISKSVAHFGSALNVRDDFNSGGIDKAEATTTSTRRQLPAKQLLLSDLSQRNTSASDVIAAVAVPVNCTDETLFGGYRCNSIASISSEHSSSAAGDTSNQRLIAGVTSAETHASSSCAPASPTDAAVSIDEQSSVTAAVELKCRSAGEQIACDEATALVSGSDVDTRSHPPKRAATVAQTSFEANAHHVNRGYDDVSSRHVTAVGGGRKKSLRFEETLECDETPMKTQEEIENGLKRSSKRGTGSVR